jgi:hypothetical protein
MRDISEFGEWESPPPEEGTFWKDSDGHVYRVDYVSSTERFVELTHLEDGEYYNEELHLFDSLYEPIITEDELGWCLLQGGN